MRCLSAACVVLLSIDMMHTHTLKHTHNKYTHTINTHTQYIHGCLPHNTQLLCCLSAASWCCWTLTWRTNTGTHTLKHTHNTYTHTLHTRLSASQHAAFALPVCRLRGVVERWHDAHTQAYTGTHNRHTQYIHTIHTHNTYTQYIHTIHAHNTYTHYIHTIHTHITYTQYIHTLHTHTFSCLTTRSLATVCLPLVRFF